MNQDSQSHLAAPELWAAAEKFAQNSMDMLNCLLELRSRIEALEREAAMTELRAASAEARHGVVVRDPECVANWPDCYEGGYDPSCCRFPKSCSCEVRRPLPGPVAEAQPAGLVERVMHAGGMGLTDSARAAIREVAAWLETESEAHLGSGKYWAARLRSEADR